MAAAWWQRAEAKADGFGRADHEISMGVVMGDER